MSGGCMPLFIYTRRGFHEKGCHFSQRSESMRQKLILVVMIVCAMLFAGCNTVKGLGQDIESGGKAIERSTGK